MSLFADGVQRGVERALDATALRQRVISHNLANSLTPGYRAQRVDFEGALGDAMRTGRFDRAVPTLMDAGGAPKTDGNTVDVEAESIGLIRSQMQYQALAEAVSHKISLLRTAVSR